MTGPALLRAIQADPDEDTPRLAYADWLDEEGDPTRAEFIRRQIAAAGRSDSARFPAPKGSRLWDLLGVTPNPGHVPETLWVGTGCLTGLVYRRGFVEAVSCSLMDFLNEPRLLSHPLRFVHVHRRRLLHKVHLWRVHEQCYYRCEVPGTKLLAWVDHELAFWPGGSLRAVLECHYPHLRFDVSYGELRWRRAQQNYLFPDRTPRYRYRTEAEMLHGRAAVAP